MKKEEDDGGEGGGDRDRDRGDPYHEHHHHARVNRDLSLLPVSGASIFGTKTAPNIYPLSTFEDHVSSFTEPSLPPDFVDSDRKKHAIETTLPAPSKCSLHDDGTAAAKRRPGAFRIHEGKDEEALDHSSSSSTLPPDTNLFHTTGQQTAGLDGGESSRPPIILTATLVPTEEEEEKASTRELPPLVEAQQISTEEEQQLGLLKRVLRDRRIVGTLVCILLIAVIVLSIGLVFGVDDDSDTEEDGGPQEQQEAALEKLQKLLGSVTPDRQALLHNSSSAYRAMDWLAKDPNLDSYDDTKKIQRWALTTLYYATAGDTDWRNSMGWLNMSLSECHWYRIICDDYAKISKIELHSNGLKGTIPKEIAVLSDSLKSMGTILQVQSHPRQGC